jgi:hypothetical protein
VESSIYSTDRFFGGYVPKAIGKNAGENRFKNRIIEEKTVFYSLFRHRLETNNHSIYQEGSAFYDFVQCLPASKRGRRDSKNGCKKRNHAKQAAPFAA